MFKMPRHTMTYYMKFDKKYQLGIIRTNSKYLDETKTALTLIKKLSSLLLLLYLEKPKLLFSQQSPYLFQ